MSHGTSIGGLAKATGTKVVTIRYYEKIGLLPEPPRTSGNYRTYDASHRERLHFIRRCRDLGFTEEQIEAIPHWQIADCFGPLERALLAYTDCLVLQGGRVPEAIFDAMKKHLSDEEILEFTYVTTTYEMHATMSRALRLEYDDVDERVVEIAAPEGSSNDVMSMVDKQKD
mgnify:CR=1 FL=1